MLSCGAAGFQRMAEGRNTAARAGAVTKQSNYLLAFRLANLALQLFIDCAEQSKVKRACGQTQ
jgi:hypothetical protein